jgi:hypothetical protein
VEIFENGNNTCTSQQMRGTKITKQNTASFDLMISETRTPKNPKPESNQANARIKSFIYINDEPAPEEEKKEEEGEEIEQQLELDTMEVELYRNHSNKFNTSVN